MIEFDVTTDEDAEYESIRFVPKSEVGEYEYVIGETIQPWHGDMGGIVICESESGAKVNIHSAQAAKNLIKALDKAMQFGWLK